MDNKYEYVKAQLAKRRQQLLIVAERTKVSRRTIGYILDGRDVRASTLNSLYEFLKENVRKKDLV